MSLWTKALRRTGFAAALGIFSSLVYFIFLRSNVKFSYSSFITIVLLAYTVPAFLLVFLKREPSLQKSCSPKLALKSFRRGFEDFGELIRNTINFVLLIVAYILGVGLTSIAAKLAGKKFLMLKPSKRKKTYWLKHARISTNIDDYYKQF